MMSLPPRTLSRCSGRQARTRLRRLRAALALSLSVLLCAPYAPATASPARRLASPAADWEALFAAKADPLLQTVRRAALSDRSSGGDVFAWGNDRAARSGLSSETEGLSKLAAVESAPDGSVRVGLTVRLAGENAEELKEAGFRVGARVGDVATLEAYVESLPRLASLDSVRKISASTYSQPTNDLARRAVNLDDAAGVRRVAQTGRGVIVGIIDTGIDFRHEDFTVPGSGGKLTRIKAILDMTVYSGQSPDPGWNYVLPGAGAPIGRLYTEDDINAALQLPADTDQNVDLVKQRDRHGHGTFTAGIAAGNGLAGAGPGKYAGMAPEADLIVAKTTRDNAGGGSNASGDVINALKFIEQKAAEMGRPFVINMSLGSNVGAHDGTMDQERAIDQVTGSGPGRAVCVSAGNYGSSDVHASGTLQPNNVTPLNIDVNAGSSPQFFGLSYRKADNLSVTLYRPDGVKIGPVVYNSAQTPGLSNQYVDIYNSLDDKRDADPGNDQKGVVIFFKDAAANLGSTPVRTWQVLLETGAVGDGHFDAWVENGWFKNFVDGSMRISTIATARGAITVGGFVTRQGNRDVGDYASYTAVGPTADGREKPDISAPSYLLYSAKSSVGVALARPLAPDGPSYVGASGTSASAPVVAGAAALLLQADPGLASERIKEVIKATAARDSFTGPSGWHERFGYGKLDVAAALLAVGPSLQLDAAVYGAGEGAGRVSFTVTRGGDTSGAAAVEYSTRDDAGLSPCGAITGIASSRCDYATTTGTLRFAPGETSKVVSIPVVDDSIPEGPETFYVTLSRPAGTALGAIAAAVLTISDNDSSASGANPLDQTAFFVRQHYIDFLGREPDPAGFQGWQDILNNCATGSTACDRVEVSSAFFRSTEFQERGYFIYRFYSAVGRIPLYSDFMPDLAKVSGFLSQAQLEANKVAFVDEFMTRPDFVNSYGSATDPTAYVNALLQTVGLPNHPSRTAWIQGLTNGSLTRAQVLRQLTESGEVNAKYFNEAFVIMQYFGYLRRSADISYLTWIQTMNTNGGDYRVMINGFVNSEEYRNRFGR